MGVGFGYYGSYTYPVYAYGAPLYEPDYYVYDVYGAGYAAGYSGGVTATSSAPDVRDRQGVSSSASRPAALPTARVPNEAAQPYVRQAEEAFRTGAYETAVPALRHAVVDDSGNGLITLLLGQALFATGHLNEAAGATQVAMRQLPRDKWGVIVQHYADLYGRHEDYTNQLQALERAVQATPTDPGLRFLAGYHYAFLGFMTEAADQLEVCVKLAPRDDLARQLRDEIREKLSRPTTPPAPLLPGLPREHDDR